jgi:hypothetical protein
VSGGGLWCRRCGYVLADPLPGHCPECGSEIALDDDRSVARTPPPWWPSMIVEFLRQAIALGAVAALVPIGMVVFVMENEQGATASLLFCAAVCGCLLVAAAVAVTAGGRRIYGLAHVIAMAIVVALHFVDTGAVKQLVRASAKVERGMSRAEVQAVLVRAFPPGGSVSLQRVELYRGVDSFLLDERWDRVLHVTFGEDDRVTRTRLELDWL